MGDSAFAYVSLFSSLPRGELGQGSDLAEINFIKKMPFFPPAKRKEGDCMARETAIPAHLLAACT